MLTLTPTDRPAESIMPPIDRGLGDTLGSAPRISTRRGLSGVEGERGEKKKLQRKGISQSLLLLPQQRVAICSISPLMSARRAISYSWYNSGGMSGLENVVALGAAASSAMTSSTCADTAGLCFSGEGKKESSSAVQQCSGCGRSIRGL